MLLKCIRPPWIEPDATEPRHAISTEGERGTPHRLASDDKVCFCGIVWLLNNKKASPQDILFKECKTPGSERRSWLWMQSSPQGTCTRRQSVITPQGIWMRQASDSSTDLLPLNKPLKGRSTVRLRFRV